MSSGSQQDSSAPPRATGKRQSLRRALVGCGSTRQSRGRQYPLMHPHTRSLGQRNFVQLPETRRRPVSVVSRPPLCPRDRARFRHGYRQPTRMTHDPSKAAPRQCRPLIPTHHPTDRFRDIRRDKARRPAAAGMGRIAGTGRIAGISLREGSARSKRWKPLGVNKKRAGPNPP